jgi:hypothetical protein
MPNNHPIMILYSLIGVLIILAALLNKQLLRWIGIKSMSEVFTNPKFQRSARITEKLGRLYLVVFGIGFLVQGLGTQFLSSDVTYTISITILGLSCLRRLAMFGVVLANWKAK